tara:strand:+ start:545 stop:919 length:375 start_codon:yes stop_codon:yes gene_type:complete
MSKYITSIIVIAILNFPAFAQQSQVLKKIVPGKNSIDLTISSNSYMMLSTKQVSQSKLRAPGISIERGQVFQLEGKTVSKLKLPTFNDLNSLKKSNPNIHISPVYLNEDGREQLISFPFSLDMI